MKACRVVKEASIADGVSKGAATPAAASTWCTKAEILVVLAASGVVGKTTTPTAVSIAVEFASTSGVSGGTVTLAALIGH
jgi:hypothetical protein